MPKNNLIILLVHHVWFVGEVFVEPATRVWVLPEALGWQACFFFVFLII